MPRRSAWAYIALLLLATCTRAADVVESERHEAEASYGRYREALLSGEPARLKRATSSYFYTRTSNYLVSAGRRLDRWYLLGYAADFVPALEVYPNRTYEANGPTAVLFMQRRIQPAGGIPRSYAAPLGEFARVRFVREQGEWKVDAHDSRAAYLFGADGTATKFDDLPGAARFVADGLVKKAPPLIQEVEEIAEYELGSSGVVVKVWVNGVEQALDGQSRVRTVVIGGLRAGENEVRITLEPLQGGGPRSLAFEILRVKKSLKGRLAYESVFRFSRKDPPLEYTARFTVAN